MLILSMQIDVVFMLLISVKNALLICLPPARQNVLLRADNSGQSAGIIVALKYIHKF